MPATRKTRTTGPAPKGTQKTLPFNNSRITKPGAAANSKSLKSSTLTPPPPAPPSKPVAIETQELDLGHISSHAAVQDQAKLELASIKGEVVSAKDDGGSSKISVPAVPEPTEEEVRAKKVTDAQVKRYWKAKEAERLAKRVHQEDLSVEEKVLRLFDMSSQYGPCIGIARMKRWTRANKLGLAPPIEVLAVLLKEEEKGHSGIERAYVDELLSSQQVSG